VRARLVFGTVDLPDTPLAPELLDRFHAGGGRALDVANVYRDGEAAQAVGRWLAARSPDGVVVYAKGCHPPHCEPELVGAEVDRARRLLGLDRIDVFILHRDDPARPVSDFADALLEQVEKGTIGAFGASNWTVPRLLELRDHLDRGGAGGLVAFSNHFSLAEMVSAPWPDCLALTKEELHELAGAEVAVLAWSSLARGFFAGREDPCWDTPANRERRDRAAQLAAQLSASTPAVALAYVLHQPDYVLPVVGTLSPAHLDDALAAADLRLTPDQLDWLEAPAARSTGPRDRLAR
jgi:aryl-alcohol dehydrogenase-like predicted oxidoreductase